MCPLPVRSRHLRFWLLFLGVLVIGAVALAQRNGGSSDSGGVMAASDARKPGSRTSDEHPPQRTDEPSPTVQADTSSGVVPIHGPISYDTINDIWICGGEEVSLSVDVGPEPIEHVFRDIDGDGLLDLIRKEPNGKLYSYKNYGSSNAPSYKTGIPYPGKVVFPVDTVDRRSKATDNGVRTRPVTECDTTFGGPRILFVYDRFDICVTTRYYNYGNNAYWLDMIFSHFENLYDLLELSTGWSAERSYGHRLSIYVDSAQAICWRGTGGHGYASIWLYYNLDNPNACAFAHFDEFMGAPLLGNLGEMGDKWRYLEVFLHEAVHAINPEPVLERGWATEGLAIYHGFNIMSHYFSPTVGQYDINQETADTYIYQGDFKWSWDGSRWGFPGYILSDYYDACNCGSPPQNWPIQNSSGYYISGWMFSMMRDNYSLDWGAFYRIVEENEETFNRALDYKFRNGDSVQFNKIYLDMPIVESFGRAMGMNFPTVKQLMRYDGPSGPGWGFREWRDNNGVNEWYADLSPTVGFSGCGDSVDVRAVIHNSGDVSLHTVETAIYVDGIPLWQDTIAISAHDSTILNVTLPVAVWPAQVRVGTNEDSTKFESYYNNNSSEVMAYNNSGADADADGYGDACDNCAAIANANQADCDDDGIGDACDQNCVQSSSLRPSVNYPAGTDPRSIFAADLDGDSDSDLAVANYHGNVLSVLKNYGNGSLATTVSYPVSSDPYAVAGADLDGDSDVDLVSANVNNDDISVLKNNGDGTFATAVKYPAGTFPSAVFAADLDWDGDIDLVTANLYADGVAVLKNNGSGVFGAAVSYAAGDDPHAVFAADLDGDGDADLAVGNRNASNISALKNNGDGTFMAPTNYSVGGNPNSVFAADLDADGDADVVTANWNSANASVLKNNGDGTFAAAVNYPTGDRPFSIFAADLDRDADADLAVTNYDSGNLSVLTNDGNGAFAPAVNFVTGTGPASVSAVDLDGDGGQDLAVANHNSDNVSVLINSSCACPQCACGCHGDPGGNCDGNVTVLDVVQAVNVAFRNAAPSIDPSPTCPYQSTDVNCSLSTDVVDVVKIVSVSFRNGNPAVEFCNPCP